MKKTEIPVGEFRWLTVVSPEGPDDLELSLEPNANPAGKAYQEALFEQGIPLTAGPVTIAICADNCGNLIQLYQVS